MFKTFHCEYCNLDKIILEMKYNIKCLLCYKQYMKEYDENRNSKRHRIDSRNKYARDRRAKLKPLYILNPYCTFCLQYKTILEMRTAGQCILCRKGKVKIYKRQYMKNRMDNHPSFKLQHYVSRTVRDTMKANGFLKNREQTWKYLAYSSEQLKMHIELQFEPWMTWQNQGVYDPKIWNISDPTTWTWQLDHIVPQSILPYSSMTDQNFKTCWALWNLRPLSAKQNQLDGCTRARHHLIVLI